MSTSLTIHGHFYQPPRENPWSERVEPESSAAPFDNWNERIHFECYRPNAFCRIVDGLGRVERIINNYAFFSFNVGPTLLSWLAEHHPATYRAIIEADRESIKKRHGHGNAIAQSYNHSILPLCNARDRQTQIKWGLADFSKHFSREAESLWLPETACDRATLENLIDERLRYVILSPFQAARVRELGQEAWQDVSGGRIDPSWPYRFYHSDGSNRFIDVFFYDRSLSHSVAFGSAIRSSEDFVAHLKSARSGPLLHAATDGETYGHHTKFGDRSFAYAAEYLVEKENFQFTNYGEFLDRVRPNHEVEISMGEDELGSSWSCAHGLGRWYRDCGCHTGGAEEWTQKWRTPLRNALDIVRDRAAEMFEQNGAALFKDPWAARDDYIDVILDRETAMNPFFERHASRKLADSERVQALRLLEQQRHAMLMYTSCGWFFNDVSGIETQQILKYAARVLDLMPEPAQKIVEEAFLSELENAVSNIPEMGTGADVYRRFVVPCKITPARATAHYAMSTLIRGENGEGRVPTSGGFEYELIEKHEHTHGSVSLLTGHLRTRVKTTGETSEQVFSAIHLGGTDLYCAVKPFRDALSFRRGSEEVASSLRVASIPKVLQIAQEHFGPEEFTLEHVLPEERQKIADVIFSGLVNRFCDEYAYLYEDSRRTLDMLKTAGFELPRELRSAAEFTLGRRFEREIIEAHESRDPQAYRNALQIAREVSELGYKIDRSHSAEIFSKMITHVVNAALDPLSAESIEDAISLVQLTKSLGIEANLDPAQERVMVALEERIRPRGLEKLAERLKLSPKLWGFSS